MDRQESFETPDFWGVQELNLASLLLKTSLKSEDSLSNTAANLEYKALTELVL